MDLPQVQPIELELASISISAKEGTGLENLKSAIDALIWRSGPPSKEEVVITSLRHHQALNNAALALQPSSKD